MAGKPVWRTTHAHVNFFCTGFAQVHYTSTRSGAAHDRVVHHHNTFPRDHFLDQIQFHSHIEIANELGWLQKCSADIVVPYECVLERNLQLFSKTKRGVVTRVGHRHDDVRFDRKSPCQFASHFHSDFSDVNAAYNAVRPRKINVFEHAECGTRIRERPFRAQSVFVDNQHFARLNFADELGVNEIERACLRCEHICAVDFSQGEWPPPERIANGDEFTFTHDQQRKCTLNTTQRGQDISTIVRRLRKKVQNYFAIGGSLKN